MKIHDFPKGSKWRVLRDGARVTGMQPDGPSCFRGCRIELEAGRVITSMGVSMTFGDGVPALKWGDENGTPLCNDATFEPHQGGMWSSFVPADGYLEKVSDK